MAEKEAIKAMQDFHIDDDRSVASSQRTKRSRSRHPSGRSHYARSRGSDDHDQLSIASEEDSAYVPASSLVRRHTQPDMAVKELPPRPMPSRSKTDTNIDMDLAYGDYNEGALAPRELDPPAPFPQPNNQQLQKIEDPELNGLVGKAQWLLEEADCLHHSAQTTMAHLEKHPDAMAAVALTLAEISNLIVKATPAALSMLKSAAPAVFGLLASPQFLIAAGVGIGATVVMFGGYKIIKQIQATTTGNSIEAPKESPKQEQGDNADEMMEINTECLSHVEMWRRGVADAEYNSSRSPKVEGEFITPTAAAMSGIDVTTARMSKDPRFKFDDDASTTSSRRSHRSRLSRREKKPESTSRSKAPSSVASGGSTKSRSKAKSPSRTPSRAPSKTPSKAPTRTYSKHESRSKESSKDVSKDSSNDKNKPKRSSKLRMMFTT